MNIVQKISERIESKQDKSETIEPNQNQDSKRFPSRGLHFPWLACAFLCVGFLSEIVDAFLLSGVLDGINEEGSGVINLIISLIVGLTCFASMAFVGYQRGNRKMNKIAVRYAYFTWIMAGLALVTVRVWAGGLDNLILKGKILNQPKFTRDLTIAVLQGVLYIGTGFLTRDSAEIVADSNIWEYRHAKQELIALQTAVRNQRAELKEGISKLRAYPEYAKRLIKSKQSVRTNIAQYNQSTRAVLEAKMATVVDPDLMEDMYDTTMAKEQHASKDSSARF